jgi:hypothetical protein
VQVLVPELLEGVEEPRRQGAPAGRSGAACRIAWSLGQLVSPPDFLDVPVADGADNQRLVLSLPLADRSVCHF